MRKSNTKAKVFHNSPPDDVTNAASAPVEAIKREFAKQLQNRMVEKGWNQSELARRAADHTTSGRFGRDVISGYIRGRNLPGPTMLHALSEALECEPSDLLPARDVPSVDKTTPSFDMKEMEDGRVWLRINRSVDWSTAAEIMSLIRKEDAPTKT